MDRRGFLKVIGLGSTPIFGAIAERLWRSRRMRYDFRDGPSPFITWMPNAIVVDGTDFSLSGRLDDNHIAGIGNLFLLAHLPISAGHFGGSLDLRNARIEFRAKVSQNFDPKGYKLRIVACASLPDGFRDPTFPMQETNWCYTGFDMTPMLSTGMQMISHVVDPDPAKWTYMGTNWLQGVYALRYAHLPLQHTLPRVDRTLHFAFVGPDRPDYHPVGKIIIQEIAIAQAGVA